MCQCQKRNGTFLLSLFRLVNKSFTIFPHAVISCLFLLSQPLIRLGGLTSLQQQLKKPPPKTSCANPHSDSMQLFFKINEQL